MTRPEFAEINKRTNSDLFIPAHLTGSTNDHLQLYSSHHRLDSSHDEQFKTSKYLQFEASQEMQLEASQEMQLEASQEMQFEASQEMQFEASQTIQFESSQDLRMMMDMKEFTRSRYMNKMTSQTAM